MQSIGQQTEVARFAYSSCAFAAHEGSDAAAKANTAPSPFDNEGKVIEARRRKLCPASSRERVGARKVLRYASRGGVRTA